MTNESLLAILKDDIVKINSCLTNVSVNYYKIGEILYYTQKRQSIETTNYKGYKNISEFALSEFGFEKTKTYNLIAVYEKFFLNNHNSEYKHYKFTNLVLMLNMTEEQFKLCDFQMTTRQIKEIKANLYKNSVRTESESIENTENTKNNNVISGVFPEKKEEKTIIVSEMPKMQIQEIKTIITEAAIMKQNDDFVTNDNIKMVKLNDEFSCYFDYEYHYNLQLSLNKKLEKKLSDSEYQYNLQSNINKQLEKQIKDLKQYIVDDLAVLNYFHEELYNINNPIQNENIDSLCSKIYDYLKSNKMPDKVRFMKEVV